jgi:short subunit dehydrogenase-like uncharacterized protein
MSGRIEWMIYGANGYTGHLVAVEARQRDLKPVLAGRRAGPIEKLAAELGLPMRVFGLGGEPPEPPGCRLRDIYGFRIERPSTMRERYDFRIERPPQE